MSQTAEMEQIDLRVTHLEEEVGSLRELLAREERERHPLIARDPQICGGEPVLSGTRTPVRAIVEQIHLGDSPQVILQQLPHLRMEQIRAALEYYREHKLEIDSAIALNDDKDFWQAWLQSQE